MGTPIADLLGQTSALALGFRKGRGSPASSDKPNTPEVVLPGQGTRFGNPRI